MASFVPPAPQNIASLMSNLEKYIHSKEKDPLVQLAIIHAQFEMIHPFGDGNGRLGRIILPIFLNFKGVLSTPMFYLSAYFEKHRDTYYSKLNNISAKGDWDSWIIYFLNAVKEQSELNIAKAKPKFEQAMRTLEPLKWSTDKEEMKVLMSKNPIWGQLLDSFLNVSIDFKFNINNIHALLNSSNQMTLQV